MDIGPRPSADLIDEAEIIVGTGEDDFFVAPFNYIAQLEKGPHYFPKKINFANQRAILVGQNVLTPRTFDFLEGAGILATLGPVVQQGFQRILLTLNIHKHSLLARLRRLWPDVRYECPDGPGALAQCVI